MRFLFLSCLSVTLSASSVSFTLPKTFWHQHVFSHMLICVRSWCVMRLNLTGVTLLCGGTELLGGEKLLSRPLLVACGVSLTQPGFLSRMLWMPQFHKLHYKWLLERWCLSWTRLFHKLSRRLSMFPCQLVLPRVCFTCFCLKLSSS